MAKLATTAILFLLIASLSWTGYRALVPTPAQAATPRASADELSSDAAYRHRNGLPNHWRGYVLQQRPF